MNQSETKSRFDADMFWGPIEADLDALLLARGIKVNRDFPIAKLSFMKAGGVCKRLILPPKVDDLIAVVAFLREHQLPFRVVGNLSNILFRDGVIHTPIVGTSRMSGHGFKDDGTYRAEAGVSLPVLAKKLAMDGYLGFSGLAGFPASVGGAVFMNASCYGDAISDYLVSVECLNPAGECVVLAKDQLGFAWRHSYFHEHLRDYTVLAANFALVKGTPEETMRFLESTKDNRLTFQEHRYPNLGSVFATRNIYGEIARQFPLYRLGYWALKLIAKFRRDRDKWWADAANRFTQRYFRIYGDDKVGFSDATFNCIVNRGGANGDEVIAFVRSVQHAIRRCVALEIELIDKLD